MRICIAGLIVAGAVFAQDKDNAAADALKKRMEALSLVAPKPMQLTLGPGAAPASKVCAIPLLNAMPKPPQGQMRTPVVVPRAQPESGGTVRVPAPSCDDFAAVEKKTPAPQRDPSAVRIVAPIR